MTTAVPATRTSASRTAGVVAATAGYVTAALPASAALFVGGMVAVWNFSDPVQKQYITGERASIILVELALIFAALLAPAVVVLTLGLSGQRWSTAIGLGAIAGITLGLPAMLIAGMMTGGL